MPDIEAVLANQIIAEKPIAFVCRQCAQDDSKQGEDGPKAQGQTVVNGGHAALL